MWRLITKDQPSATEPFRANEFDSAMARFAPFSTDTFALGVSGGPDSMTLAVCARDWAAARNFKLRAFIVDHALRPESSAEAATVQKQLFTLGIPAEILRWDHAPVISKLHITARKARYRLLTEACKKAGISELLVAHQLEDQAETVLMRLAKGSGIDGLAGIAAVSTMNGVRLLRPFLNISKERLISLCRERKISFVADPSNASEKFARGRLRRVLPLLANEGLTVERLADLAARAKDAKDALEHFTSLLLRDGCVQDDTGVIRLDLDQLRSSPRAIAERAVAACLQSIHIEDYAPEHVSLASLAAALRADNEMTPRTLHGCLISKTDRDAIFIRELSSISDAPAIAPGESVIWDGRWQVTLPAESSGAFTIRPLANPPHDIVDGLAPGLRKKVPQGRARAVLPGLWQGETLVAIPSLFPAAHDENLATMRLLKPELFRRTALRN